MPGEKPRSGSRDALSNRDSGTRDEVRKFGSLSIGMHWLMLVLIVAVYACIELREFFPKGSDPRELLKRWHFMLGMSVFVLIWLRLALYLLGPVPLIQPQSARWEMRLAHLVQAALYVLMIGMPIMGWLTLNAGGKPVPFFGLELPALMGEDKYLAEVFKEIHKTAGVVGYWLIGLHAAAALFHHYLIRDNTLRRMLPFRD